MNQSTKLRLASIVTKWELENFALFLRFSEAKRVKTAKLANKHASIQKGDGMIERLIHEMPVELDEAIRAGLSEEENHTLQTREGAIWFAKTFPQYRVAETV